MSDRQYFRQPHLTLYLPVDIQPGDRAQVCRSEHEAEIAFFLDVHEIDWLYEPGRQEGTGYLPDFFIARDRLLIEGKGGVDENDRAILTPAAATAKSRGAELLLWNTGRDAWQIVRSNGRFGYSRQGHLLRCAACLRWTFQSLCPDCGNTGFSAEHAGVTNVRVPVQEMQYRSCPAASVKGQAIAVSDAERDRLLSTYNALIPVDSGKLSSSLLDQRRAAIERCEREDHEKCDHESHGLLRVLRGVEIGCPEDALGAGSGTMET